MAYWLVKTEPQTYSFQDLRKEKIAVWGGVSNPLALKHLRSMKKLSLESQESPPSHFPNQNNE
jgi:predicted RNA-binding protein with PUA-like domain